MTADILGSWSHDHLYTSAMEDHWLYFGPNGEGAYAYLRPGFVRGAVFTWRLAGGGLTTRTVREFSGDKDDMRRDDGQAFDGRAVPVTFSERFAFQLGRSARVLELGEPGDATHVMSAVPHPLDFAFMGPACPSPLQGQLRRAHAYFDRRGGLPRPRP